MSTPHLRDVCTILIQHICEEQGWNAADLAKAIGKNPTQCGRILAGQQSGPSLEYLSLILGALEMDPIDFFSRWEGYRRGITRKNAREVAGEILRAAAEIGPRRAEELVLLALKAHDREALDPLLKALDRLAR